MRFSLRTMTSGARNSINFFKRLLRLMTRRYKSFKSDVAKRPPSNGTRGRNSGGMTGITSRIIHSGLFPDFKKLVATFNRFEYLSFFCCDVSSFIRTRRSVASSSIWTIDKSSLIASAPILATNCAG